MANRVYYKNQTSKKEIEPISSCRANCTYTCPIGLVCHAHIEDVYLKSEYHKKRAIAKRDGEGFLNYDWKAEFKKFQEEFYPIADEEWMEKVDEYNK